MSPGPRKSIIVVTVFMVSLWPELARAAGSDGEVMRAADGSWKGPVKTQHFCDQQNHCRDLVIDLKTRKLLSVDGKVIGPFRATGSGQEIVRDSSREIPTKIVNGKVVPAKTP
jgi:hypothetical protein